MPDLGGFYRLFIPSHVFESRDRNDEIVGSAGVINYSIHVLHARTLFVLVDYVMANWHVVVQDITNLEHLRWFIVSNDVLEYRDFYGPLVAPGIVVRDLEIAERLALKREGPPAPKSGV